jgi:hypothetical protein
MRAHVRYSFGGDRDERATSQLSSDDMYLSDDRHLPERNVDIRAKLVANILEYATLSKADLPV